MGIPAEGYFFYPGFTFWVHVLGSRIPLTDLPRFVGLTMLPPERLAADSSAVTSS